jgi:hypothetical protein
MKKIVPFTSQQEALITLDNGGRFYNMITKANDGNINTSELSKVAGIISDKQRMILYLELSLYKLSGDSRKGIIKTFSQDLKSAVEKYAAQYLSPSEATKKGELARNTVLEGIPRYVESKSDFSGFIMIPIMSGKTTTFMMVPIFDHYDVYELRDDATSDTFLIAHSKGSEKLPERKITVGGILKELKKDKKDVSPATKFLEAHYYIAS